MLDDELGPIVHWQTLGAEYVEAFDLCSTRQCAVITFDFATSFPRLQQVSLNVDEVYQGTGCEAFFSDRMSSRSSLSAMTLQRTQW